MRGLIFLIFLFSLSVHAAGRLQDADFKTEAELDSAGADKTYLLNTTKIYDPNIAKTLDDAIADGDIGGDKLTVKGNLIGFSTLEQECVLDKTDGKILTVDSTATCGFEMKDAPISVPTTTKGDISTHDGANPTRQAVGANGSIPIADSTKTNGWFWDDSVVVQTKDMLRVRAITLTGATSTTSFAFNYVNSITELEDDQNALADTGDIVFTVPTGYGGYYTFDFGARVDTGAVIVGMECGLSITGGTTPNKALTISSNAAQHYIKCIFEDIKLSVGDTVKFYSRKSGTSSVTWNTDTRFNYLNITQTQTKNTFAGTFGDCQTKYLSADITVNTNDISDLRFTGLSIGSRYQISLRLATIHAALDTITMVSNSNGTNICKVSNATDSGSFILSGNVCSFVAGSSSLLVDGISIAATNSIRGDGSIEETSVELCSLKKGEATSW